MFFFYTHNTEDYEYFYYLNVFGEKFKNNIFIFEKFEDIKHKINIFLVFESF